jgi:hypothetical protein
MTQALYAHMNIKRKKKEENEKQFRKSITLIGIGMLTNTECYITVLFIGKSLLILLQKLKGKSFKIVYPLC